MQTEANEITRDQVERAMEWAGPPLAELFKSPMKLKAHDLVTMKLSELGHMLAWYAKLQGPRQWIEFTQLAEDTPEIDNMLPKMLTAEGAIGDDRSLGEG